MNRAREWDRTSVHVLPRLILCFSPDRIPGVSITLMLSSTGFGSCAHTNLQGKTRVRGGRAGDLKETGQKCKTFKTTSTVAGQTPALSSISAFLHSLQLNKLVRLSKVTWVKPPPPPTTSAAATVSVYSLCSLWGKCEKILAFSEGWEGSPVGQPTRKKPLGEWIPARAHWEIQSQRNVEPWRRLSLALSGLLFPCFPSVFCPARHPISENSSRVWGKCAVTCWGTRCQRRSAFWRASWGRPLKRCRGWLPPCHRASPRWRNPWWVRGRCAFRENPVPTGSCWGDYRDKRWDVLQTPCWDKPSMKEINLLRFNFR